MLKLSNGAHSCSCLGYLLEGEKTHNSTATQIDWFLVEDRKTCPFLLCDKRSSELNKVVLNKTDPLSLGLKFCFFPSESTYQNHFTLKSYITLRWNIKKVILFRFWQNFWKAYETVKVNTKIELISAALRQLIPSGSFENLRSLPAFPPLGLAYISSVCLLLKCKLTLLERV